MHEHETDTSIEYASDSSPQVGNRASLYIKIFWIHAAQT